MLEDFWANALFSLAPTVLLGLIFWFVMRAVIRSDRSERKAYARVEAEERQKLGMPPADQDPLPRPQGETSSADSAP